MTVIYSETKRKRQDNARYSKKRRRQHITRQLRSLIRPVPKGLAFASVALNE